MDEKIKKMTKLVKEKILSRIQVNSRYRHDNLDISGHLATQCPVEFGHPYLVFSSKQLKSFRAQHSLVKQKRSSNSLKTSDTFLKERAFWKSPS